MSEKDPIRIGVTLEANTVQKFLAIKQQIGVRTHADIVRWLINWYYEREGLEKSQPLLKHFNLNEDGVRIQDLNLATSNSPHGLIIDVAFKPKGIWCDYCETNDCRHIEFALSVSAIQKVIRKRIRDGWNLPEP